jgi:hypothetical protein
MIDTRYDYDPAARSRWGFHPRSLMSDPEWHEQQTEQMQSYQPGGWTCLVDRTDHPEWVISPSGGLVHLVEFVVMSYAPLGYGDSSLFYLVCGQFRSWDRCAPVAAPETVCHKCHDRHWLKTGEHLPAIPQSGCEVTEGTFFVSKRAQAVRAKAAAVGVGS